MLKNVLNTGLVRQMLVIISTLIRAANTSNPLHKREVFIKVTL